MLIAVHEHLLAATKAVIKTTIGTKIKQQLL